MVREWSREGTLTTSSKYSSCGLHTREGETPRSRPRTRVERGVCPSLAPEVRRRGSGGQWVGRKRQAHRKCPCGLGTVGTGRGDRLRPFLLLLEWQLEADQLEEKSHCWQDPKGTKSSGTWHRREPQGLNIQTRHWFHVLW